MEMEGSHGGRRSYWSYLQKIIIGSNGGRGSSWRYRRHGDGMEGSSSRSGTIVSSAYASSASSRPSNFSMGVAMHFDSLGIHEEEEHDGNNRKAIIIGLVQEFFIERSTASCCIKVGDLSVMERWLTELGVGWVLGLDLVAHTWKELYRDARIWIQALDKIAQRIRPMSRLFPDGVSVGLPSIHDEGEHASETYIPDRYHFALFIQETMLKMLTFVDAIVAWDPVMSPSYEYDKLIALLGVHDALPGASDKILSVFDDSQNSLQVQRIQSEMAILLLAKKRKVREVIRSTMEKIRTKSMGDDDESTSSLDPQESSDIHKVTRSVMAYIQFLWINYRSVDAAIRGKHVPEIQNIRPLDSMIIEMLSCLEEKLANISESFPDQGLRFLFLLNNSYNIQQQVHDPYLCSRKRPVVLAVDLTHKIESHLEKYVEVSWVLLLSCLLNPMPLCLGKNYSPLPEFESEFHKIYTTQKQWKVPHPELRRRLRKTICNKIIPAYTEYLEDNKVTIAKFTPQELEEMLQELFEG